MTEVCIAPSGSPLALAHSRPTDHSWSLAEPVSEITVPCCVTSCYVRQGGYVICHSDGFLWTGSHEKVPGIWLEFSGNFRLRPTLRWSEFGGDPDCHADTGSDFPWARLDDLVFNKILSRTEGVYCEWHYITLKYKVPVLREIFFMMFLVFSSVPKCCMFLYICHP